MGLEALSVPADRIAAAIDERTAAVCLSHVLFRSSYIVDPTPVIEKAHAVGAVVVLDGYQSAGIIPVDVTALGVDFFVGGCLKWLCGGPGNAFLYTAPWVKAKTRPHLTGWLSRDFVVDYRPGVGIRLSPHFYNTMAEVDAMMHEVDRIVRTKAYAIS